MTKKNAVEILKSFGKTQHVMLLTSEQIQEVPTIPSGILSLDIALSGKPGNGYAKGRIIELFGVPAGGKSTTALQAIAAVQAEGNVAAFIDAEHCLDVDYATRLGVKVDELLISQPDYGEQALEVALGLAGQMGDGDLIVVDSVAALTPKAELDGEMEAEHVGLQARMMSKALRKLTSTLSKNLVTIIFINQIRDKLMVMYGPKTDTPGGKALKFSASQRVEVTAVGQIKATANKVEEVVGNRTQYKVVKNKTFPPFRVAETEIHFGYGVPRAIDVLKLAEAKGIIEKEGMTLSYQGGKLGNSLRQAFLFLQEEPETLGWIEKEVLEAHDCKS